MAKSKSVKHPGFIATSQTANISNLSSGTATINGTTTTTTTTISNPYIINQPFIGYSAVVNKTTYYFMGEEIEVDGYKSLDIAMVLASIESMGWKYYESLIRNEVTFNNEILKHLERLYKQHNREQKIDNILE